MTNYVPTRLAYEIAGILRGRAARYDVTQADLAHATGISQSQISKMLRGKRPMDIDTMDRVAFALGLDAAKLVEEAFEATDSLNWTPPARFKYVDERGRLECPIDYGDDLPSGEQPPATATVTPMRPAAEEPNWEELDAGQWAAKKKTSAEELDPDRD